MTRRGYGLSAAPADSAYSNGALVADVLGLMRALDIGAASFVGHSIAGGELATLGARHPAQVERLVNLDAAYDRSRVPELMSRLPAMPSPDADTRGTLERLTRWREATLGVESPAVGRNLSQITEQGPEGLNPRTAPSLALYSSKDVADQVPPTATDAQRKAMVDFSIKQLRPWMLRAQAIGAFLSDAAPCTWQPARLPDRRSAN